MCWGYILVVRLGCYVLGVYTCCAPRVLCAGGIYLLCAYRVLCAGVYTCCAPRMLCFVN